MAEKQTYPKIPASQWWALRKQFKKSIPSIVDGKYLASVLNMSAISAQTNILPSLRLMGIVGEDGKPTELAVRWRSDEQYKNVCNEIVKSVYPASLRDVASDADDDKASVQRWFASHGAGENLVGKCTAVYMMLLNGEPSEKPNSVDVQSKRPSARKVVGPSKSNKKIESQVIYVPEPESGNNGRSNPNVMPLHLNIQIHIGADASAEQIEKIFESMARHLKN